MMKEYPVVVWNEKGKRKAYIPDFDLYVDGLRAAKDAIGSRWLELDEENRTMPEPSDLTSVAEAHLFFSFFNNFEFFMIFFVIFNYFLYPCFRHPIFMNWPEDSLRYHR